MKNVGPYRGLSVDTLHTLHFPVKAPPLEPHLERDEEGMEGLANPPFQPSTTLHTLHLVETIDGMGYLSGNRKEQDITLVAHARKERLRYKIGVIILQDGVERFYYPGTLSDPRPEAIQAYEQAGKVLP